MEAAEPVSSDPVAAAIRLGDGLILDGRLALFHESERWLAVADLHFGFEAGRRRDGALWPLWGMESVASRLSELVVHYRPVTLVLVGDVVDGAAEPGAAREWLASLRDLGPEVILIVGNHDRGPVRKEFFWSIRGGRGSSSSNTVIARLRRSTHPGGSVDMSIPPCGWAMGPGRPYVSPPS